MDIRLFCFIQYTTDRHVTRIYFTDSRFVYVMFLKDGPLFRATCIVHQGGDQELAPPQVIIHQAEVRLSSGSSKPQIVQSLRFVIYCAAYVELKAFSVLLKILQNSQISVSLGLKVASSNRCTHFFCKNDLVNVTHQLELFQ